jgi:outer membrane protein
MEMKRLFLALSAAGLMVGAQAQADTLLGLYAGIDGWSMDSEGNFGSSAVEVQEFNLDNETKPVLFVALEHPVPVIPNIRIRTNDLTTSGSATIGSFNYAGQTFSGDVNVDFDIQNIDFTLYYEILDNDTVSLDIGLTGKYIDGEIAVEQADLSVSASETFKGVIPMLYGAAQIGVPATGLSFFGELHGLSIGDSTLLDYQVGAAYEFIDNPAVDMAVRAGYREFSLELEDLDDIHTDWSFKGPFVGLQLHF